MNLYLKNNVDKLKNALTSLLMVGVLASGGLEIIIPHSSEADFLAEISGPLTNTFTAQENTILQPNPIEPLGVAKKIKMVITAYSSTVEETDSTPFITASGKTVRDGIVANNLLPFGTKVRIPELYGDKVFVVQDRMNPRIGGHHLDIWFPSHSEAEVFGSELSYVEILEN